MRRKAAVLSLFTSFTFLGAVLFIIIGLSSLGEEEGFLAKAHSSKGQIIRIDESQGAQIPFVRFQTQNGQTIEAPARCCNLTYICVLGRCVPRFIALGGDAGNFTVGEQVSLLYNTEHPEDIQIQPVDSRSYSFQTSRSLTVGFILLFVALFLCLPTLIFLVLRSA